MGCERLPGRCAHGGASRTPRLCVQTSVLVVGTEAGDIIIMEPSGTVVSKQVPRAAPTPFRRSVTHARRQIRVPSTPVSLSVQGALETDHRIMVSCRNHNIYTLKVTAPRMLLVRSHRCSHAPAAVPSTEGQGHIPRHGAGEPDRGHVLRGQAVPRRMHGRLCYLVPAQGPQGACPALGRRRGAKAAPPYAVAALSPAQNFSLYMPSPILNMEPLPASRCGPAVS